MLEKNGIDISNFYTSAKFHPKEVQSFLPLSAM